MIESYDVAVVGAGLVSCPAAFELAQRGRTVVVFDQSGLNNGASGRNAGGLFAPTYAPFEPQEAGDS